MSFWHRKDQRLRYYIYISSTKVDSFFDQIPLGLRKRIAADLKLDLKLISVTLRENVSNETRISKLAVVDKYFENQPDVGTLANPRAYIRGRLSMRWGPWHTSPGLIYFDGVSQNALVGLGGSRSHVIGEPPAGQEAAAWSAGYNIIMALTKSGDIPELDEFRAFLNPAPGSPYEASEWAGAAQDPPDAHLTAVQVAHRYMLEKRYPSQEMEFFARVYFSGDPPEPPVEGDPKYSQVVLGSPIWVALAD
jgi:hypothetical protein